MLVRGRLFRKVDFVFLVRECLFHKNVFCILGMKRLFRNVDFVFSVRGRLNRKMDFVFWLRERLFRNVDFVFWYTGLFGPPYGDEYKSHPQGLKVTVVENLTPQGDKSYDENP